MSLQLKMRLQAATKQMLGEQQITYALCAVSGDENKPWSKYTPSGNLTFVVTNPAAPELDAGDYLITLTKVEP